MFNFAYEPDERPKRKHHWDQPIPGFLKEGNALVGKCPNTLTVQAAAALLRDGMAYNPSGWSETWPKRIYVVIEGVPYRATPTIPGQSYHGFPEHPRELRRLPRALLDLLEERASDQNRIKEFKAWLIQ